MSPVASRPPCPSGHDDDIQCLAVHPNRTLVATGQVASTRACPMLCVWDTTIASDRRGPSGDAPLLSVPPGSVGHTLAAVSDECPPPCPHAPHGPGSP